MYIKTIFSEQRVHNQPAGQILCPTLLVVKYIVNQSVKRELEIMS
jgi:hypothetical protein